MQQGWDKSRRFRPYAWVVFWPVFTLMLLSALWGVAAVRGEQERQRTERMAVAETLAAAQAYEQYITRSVANIDQVSMQLTQSWAQSMGGLRLDDMQRDGMFVDGAFACVVILDRRGEVRSAIRQPACGAQFADTDFFRHHQGNNTSALRIGPPHASRGSAHATILFSRRLDSAESEFDGVVLLAVNATYFTSFYMPSTFGSAGLVATFGAENSLRAEHSGALSSEFPADPQRWQSENAGAAVVRGAGAFPDGQPRVLGWRRSPGYPLVGLVAISHAEAMAPYAAWQAESRNNALLAALALSLGGAGLTTVSWRAAARRRARADVHIAYRTATEGAADGFFMATPVRGANGQIADFTIVDCNESGARFHGLGRKAMIGTRLSQLPSADLFQAYVTAMEAGFHEDERQTGSPGAAQRWARRRIVRVGDGLAITLQDISERRAHVAELQRLSNEDGLTGLPNRQWLLNHLPGVLAHARTSKSEIAMLFIDLDDFRYVNEAHGHGAGDEVLKAAAQRLRSLLRPGDCVVRFGGDEFLVLLVPAEDDARTDRVAARIVSAFAAPFPLGRELLDVGASVGVSIFPRDGADAADLIKQAGIAMDASKTEGKGRYRFYDATLQRSVHTRMQLKQSLVEAIEKDQFVLYYQPRVDALTGELRSMEALVRWLHPQRGLVPPLDFIALAEATGLILRIGDIVMQKACEQIDAWRSAGLALVPVSVNVSPKQFARGEVAQQLTSCLARHRTPPGLLEVEITESAMMGEQDDIIAQLDAIRALGVKLHVDDFGTGYSSLSQLQKLKMDVLKVDRAFTTELGSSKEGKVFFQAIVSMAHALGMEVVAEGVETAGQLAILQELGCNEVQGYFVSRPVPAADMATLMHERFLFRNNPLSLEKA